MKDYEGFLQMNENANELALLQNLYQFYFKKYKGNLTKFKEQVEILVSQKELTRKNVNKFYNENDITVEIKTKKTKGPGGERVTKDKGRNDGEGGLPGNLLFRTPPDGYGSGCGSDDDDNGCGSISSRSPHRNSDRGCGSTNAGC